MANLFAQRPARCRVAEAPVYLPLFRIVVLPDIAVVPIAARFDKQQLPHLADLPVIDRLAHRDVPRRIVKLHRVKHHLIRPRVGGGLHRLAFVPRRRHRLLAHHVLPRLQRRQHHFLMHAVRRGNQHRVDIRIGQQLVIIDVSRRAGRLLRGGGEVILHHVAHAKDAHVVGETVDGVEMNRAAVPRADQAPAQRWIGWFGR